MVGIEVENIVEPFLFPAIGYRDTAGIVAHSLGVASSTLGNTTLFKDLQSYTGALGGITLTSEVATNGATEDNKPEL